MICGEERHFHSVCLREIDDAVRASTTRLVALNAHYFDAPAGAVIYNLDLVGTHVNAADARWAGREIWDFSEKNIAAWKTAVPAWKKTFRRLVHVPVGYHPTMERFERRPRSGRDIDLVFTGAINERRHRVLSAVRQQGHHVVVLSTPTFGAERDALLARARLALNMLYYEKGVFPVLRAAHLAANGVPFISEEADETPSWVVESSGVDDLVEHLLAALACRDTELETMADLTRERFRKHPLVLPEEGRPQANAPKDRA